MRLREYKNNKMPKQVNEIILTGKILSNKENTEFGDSLYAIYPFNGEPLVPLVIESSTTYIIETDDGFEDTKKNIFNANLYKELIDKVTDNKDFYVGCRVQIKGYLISKNFSKTEEKSDIMNICNRYKNINDGERPFLCEGSKPFLDKESGMSLTKNLIDWNSLLESGLLDNIPDEEAQENGKIEYFYLEDGRVFKQEQKTNYIVMVKEIEFLDGFLNPFKGDENSITVCGYAKDIQIYEYEGYQAGRFCLISKSEDMTRNSYIHVTCRGKNLEPLKNLSMGDMVNVIGKVKHRVIEKVFTKKKGKKEILITHYTNVYEIDCKELEIYREI